jgi:hypothetical protein
MDVSGEGNDKDFAAYLHQKDWHPKVMKVVHRLAVADPAFMNWAYRSSCLGGASNAPNSGGASNAPDGQVGSNNQSQNALAGGGRQRAARSRQEMRELTTAVTSANETLAAAIRDAAATKAEVATTSARHRARSSRIDNLRKIAADRDLPEATRESANRQLVVALEEDDWL